MAYKKEKVIMVDRLPVSSLGITLVRKCKWCPSIIYPKQQSKNIIFCSDDCRDEYKDWLYLQKGNKKEQDRTRINLKYKENKEYREKLKKYWKEYYKKNKKSCLDYQKKYNKKKKVALQAIRDEVNK